MKKIDELMKKSPFFTKKEECRDEFSYHFKEGEYEFIIARSKNLQVAFPICMTLNKEFKKYADFPLWIKKLEYEGNELYFKINRLRNLFEKFRRPFENILYFETILSPRLSFLWERYDVGNDKLYLLNENEVDIVKEFLPQLERFGYTTDKISFNGMRHVVTFKKMEKFEEKEEMVYAD